MTEFLVFIDILAWYMLSLFVRLSVTSRHCTKNGSHNQRRTIAQGLYSFLLLKILAKF